MRLLTSVLVRDRPGFAVAVLYVVVTVCRPMAASGLRSLVPEAAGEALARPIQVGRPRVGTGSDAYPVAPAVS